MYGLQARLPHANTLSSAFERVLIADDREPSAPSVIEVKPPTSPTVSTAVAVTAVHAGLVHRAIFKSPLVSSQVADEGEPVDADRDRRVPSRRSPTVSTLMAMTAVHAAVVQRATFKLKSAAVEVADHGNTVGAHGDRREGPDVADGVDAVGGDGGACRGVAAGDLQVLGGGVVVADERDAVGADRDRREVPRRRPWCRRCWR